MKFTFSILLYQFDGNSHDNRLSLTKHDFCEALELILRKGTRRDYMELFDEIDVLGEGTVDWDKLTTHMMREFKEKDDKVKSTQVPQWKDIKHLSSSPHKDIIQRFVYVKQTNRYMAVSKEGCVSMWSSNLKLQRSLKTQTDACKQRDVWVTHFVVLHNVNKLALSFTSKEIAIYDLSSKLDLKRQYCVQGELT